MPNKYWCYDTCIYDSWHADGKGMPGVYFINLLPPKEDLEIDIQEVESGIFKGKNFDMISYVSLNMYPRIFAFLCSTKTMN